MSSASSSSHTSSFKDRKSPSKQQKKETDEKTSKNFFNFRKMFDQICRSNDTRSQVKSHNALALKSGKEKFSHSTTDCVCDPTEIEIFENSEFFSPSDENLNEAERRLLFQIFNEKKHQFKASIFTLIDHYYKKYNFKNDYTSQNDIEIDSNKDLLNDTDIKVLKIVWTSVKKDIEKVGMVMFMRSFESTPELKEAFSSFRDMNRDDLIKSHLLRSHSQKVMSIVDKVIQDIDKEDNNLVEMLIALGRMHSIYGATDEFLYIMEKQFVDSIKPYVVKFVVAKSKLNDVKLFEDESSRSLPSESTSTSNGEVSDAFTKEENDMKIAYIQTLWRKVFSFIKKNMSVGINDSKNKKKISL